MSDVPRNSFAGGPHNVDLWTREGFMGAQAIALRSTYGPDYISVEGPHAPRRALLNAFPAADKHDASALPLPIMLARNGVSISVTQRRKKMPFVLSNVEADELHFVQAGKATFETLYGSIEAVAGDFVCVPRAIPYRVDPLGSDFIALIVESPGAFRFDTPTPFGVIHFDHSLRRAKMPAAREGDDDENTVVLLKSFDGVTKFVRPHDPLRAVTQVGGIAPVWALSLSEIHPISYAGPGGPPAQFLSSPGGELLFYTMSSRPCASRPPIHHNADYDEILFYAQGPGAWGAVSEPGTLTHVPKGVTHQGPMEDVPEGYQAWLLELRPTLRFTPDALASTLPMETCEYGVHPSARINR